MKALRDLVLVTLAVACLNTACQAAEEREAKPRFKGVELYSWKDTDGEWMFVLLDGTNRSKSEKEIKASKHRVKGVDKLKSALALLAVREQVFWLHRGKGFEYPSKDTQKEITSAAEKVSIDLHGPRGFSIESSRTGEHPEGKGVTKLKVAVAQIPVSSDIATNEAAIHRAVDHAIEAGAEILLTPEGSLSGYTHLFDQKQVDKALKGILQKAKSAGLALALGTCFVEPDDGKCYNQIRFYDTDGAFLGFHTKTLLCGTLTKPSKGEINHYSTRPLRTFQIKRITVGGLICNDMWANPGCTPMPDSHLSQQLSAAGAKIIFHAINGGRNGGKFSEDVNWPFHETNQRMRAIAGKVWIVAADNCAPTTIPCSAPSGVLRPDGQWVARAKRQGEQVVVYTIDLN